MSVNIARYVEDRFATLVGRLFVTAEVENVGIDVFHIKLTGQTLAEVALPWRLTSYTPTEGDVVLCIYLGGRYIVLGAITS